MVAMQIRDVPDAVRQALRREAESRGQSLQVFLLEVLEREARFARNRARVRTQMPLQLDGVGPIDVVALIQESHEERDRHILDAAVESGRVRKQEADANRDLQTRR